MTRKKLYWQLPFLLLLMIGSVIVIYQQQNTPYQHNTGKIFGTTYNISYQSDQNLHKAIVEELTAVDQSLSMFNDSSIISRINQGQEPDIHGTMFEEIFQLAQEISAATDGAFDITVAPLVNAWGFGFKVGKMPTHEELDSLRQLVDYQKLELKKEGRKVFVHKAVKGMMLDCSAIAKGYGCDRVAKLLKRHDIKNYMIEIGGEVVTHGNSDKQKSWRIGITSPTSESLPEGQELQAVLSVNNRAMATSGNYRNYYYKNGRKYAHTIDPKTGLPVQHNILSATVLAPSCAIADAYATAFMVMGLERAQKILQRHPELCAYLIYTDAKGNYATWASKELEQHVLQHL